jgi:hypothetical protein
MERSTTGVRTLHRGECISSELTARAEQSLGELRVKGCGLGPSGCYYEYRIFPVVAGRTPQAAG